MHEPSLFFNSILASLFLVLLEISRPAYQYLLYNLQFILLSQHTPLKRIQTFMSALIFCLNIDTTRVYHLPAELEPGTHGWPPLLLSFPEPQ